MSALLRQLTAVQGASSAIGGAMRDAIGQHFCDHESEAARAAIAEYVRRARNAAKRLSEALDAIDLTEVVAVSSLEGDGNG